MSVDQFNLFVDKDMVLKCKGRIGKANVSDDANNPTTLLCRFAYLLLPFSNKA